MRMLTAHAGKLQVVTGFVSPARGGFTLDGLDRLLPGGLPRAAVHEILTPPGQSPAFFLAGLLARAGSADASSLIAWFDPEGTLYPPALQRWGIPMDRLLLLRPQGNAEQAWAAAECLRCRGVGATVAAFERLSRIQARRLQLAAEAGGGVGIFLRTAGQSGEYAAATRWLIRAIPGQRLVQRWELQLIHGHGGHLGQIVILEACRETGSVRVSESVADRSVAAAM
jgi:protein ImuA